MSQTSQPQPAVLRLERVFIDPAEMKTILGQRRAALGLSIKALAKKAGVAPTTVHRLEQGDVATRLDIFLRVVDALGLIPSNIIHQDGETDPVPTTELERQMAALLRQRDFGALLRLVADTISASESEFAVQSSTPQAKVPKSGRRIKKPTSNQ